MSHPGAISCRCSLTISRNRRRIRLRRTAVPSAFLILQPKRLILRLLGRIKTVNSRLALRRPSRYTASYSTRRTKRQALGKVRDASDAGKAMASFFAALRKNFASTLALHARAETVLLVATAHVGLKCAFRQRIFSLSILTHTGIQRDLHGRRQTCEQADTSSRIP